MATMEDKLDAASTKELMELYRSLKEGGHTDSLGEVDEFEVPPLLASNIWPVDKACHA